MGARSTIEWTDSSWAVSTGCTKLSEGCANCYADAYATRFAETKSWPNGFQVTLDLPLKWPVPVVDDNTFEHGRAYDLPHGGRIAPVVRVPGPAPTSWRDGTVRLMEPGER